MALWDALKRANKAPLADDEIERIIEFGRKYYEPYGWEGHTEEFVEFARRNLKNRAGTKMIFYYNRGSGYVYDEWHTFMDEWSMKDFTNRKRRDPWAVSTIPSESQLDYSMWWYKKSFELGGNIGIYVDNNAFLPGYNTVMTGAHKKDDGSIMPSSGIWGLRALAKRQFTLMNELGMEPITMSHTSTLQILPINAFYTIQYDGEWKYSEGDFHDRFSREYLIHISSGDMDGAWPIMLHEVGKNKWDYWTLRTYHGVCTVHDVIIDRYLWHFYPVPEDSPENPMHYKLRMPLCEMAQEPDCEVYRYWDDRPQPVTSGDWDLPTIVYSLPGREAVVAVTNFSSTDKECVLSIDTDTLGFPGRCTATDMETDEEIAVKNNQIRFILKKHNLRQLKLTRKTG
jgi:hypothetical protein